MNSEENFKYFTAIHAGSENFCSAILGLMKLVIGVHARGIYFVTVACKQECFMYSAHIEYSNSSPALSIT